MLQTVLAAVAMLGVWSVIEYRSWRLSHRREEKRTTRARSATNASEVVDETHGV